MHEYSCHYDYSYFYDQAYPLTALSLLLTSFVSTIFLPLFDVTRWLVEFEPETFSFRTQGKRHTG